VLSWDAFSKADPLDITPGPLTASNPRRSRPRSTRAATSRSPQIASMPIPRGRGSSEFA